MISHSLYESIMKCSQFDCFVARTTASSALHYLSHHKFVACIIQQHIIRKYFTNVNFTAEVSFVPRLKIQLLQRQNKSLTLCEILFIKEYSEQKYVSHKVSKFAYLEIPRYIYFMQGRTCLNIMYKILSLTKSLQ